MPISLPRSLHRRLAERARSDGNTRTAIILTAVNRSHDSIGVALNPPPVPSGNDLFDIPQRGPRKEPSVETTIRVTDRQQSAIEALAETHHVNRSRLICTALEVYLS
jgi:predicted transcriptional regulator